MAARPSPRARRESPKPATPGSPPRPAPALDPEGQRLLEQIVKHLPAAEQERARGELEQGTRRVTGRHRADPASGERSLRPGQPQVRPGARARGQGTRGRAARGLPQDRGGRQGLWPRVLRKRAEDDVHLPAADRDRVVRPVLPSGRYYVEHLLFFVHFHAFFFLGGMALLRLEQLATGRGHLAEPGFDVVQGILGSALMLYVPYYLHRAMRRVYAQGRWRPCRSTRAAGRLPAVHDAYAGGLAAYTALTL